MPLFILLIRLLFGFSGLVPNANPAAQASRPDIYPSRKAAASAMADQIVDALPRTPFFGPTIILTYPTNSVPPFTVDLANSLQAKLPSISVVFDQVYRHKSSNSPTINIVDNSKSENDNQGDFSAIFAKPPYPSLEVKYIDKPWAADWTTFIDMQAPHAWIFGSSNALCESEDQANEMAYADAARKITRILRQKYSGLTTGRTDEQLRDYVVQSLNNISAEAIHDKFVQRFDQNDGPQNAGPQSDGPAWRESILVSADDNTLGLMMLPLSRAGPVNTSPPTAVIHSTLAMAPLIVLLLLVCLFLNWITKGYFTTRLRITSFTGLLMAAVLLFLGLFTAHISYSPSTEQQPSQMGPHTFGPAIALVIVIILLYLFLNWITKGYFHTRLMIVAIALGLIGVIAFLLLFYGGPPVSHPVAIHEYLLPNGGTH